LVGSILAKFGIIDVGLLVGLILLSLAVSFCFYFMGMKLQKRLRQERAERICHVLTEANAVLARKWSLWRKHMAVRRCQWRYVTLDRGWTREHQFCIVLAPEKLTTSVTVRVE
jgi:hypothetical protein